MNYTTLNLKLLAPHLKALSSVLVYLNAIAYCLIAKSTFKQHAIGLFWCSCATWNCEVVTFEVFLSFIGLFCKNLAFVAVQLYTLMFA